MPYDPTHHRRRSIRLPGYDYTRPGAYFVTICAVSSLVFGRVVDDEVALNPPGHIVAAAWCSLPRHFAGVSLDTWILMPDHLHGIIVIEQSDATASRPGPERPRGTAQGSLSAMVQNFKSVSARRINKLNNTPGRRVWQEDYFEHIIRDDADLTRIRHYIVSNPARWKR